MAKSVVDAPEIYSTAFGYSGTYWDYVREIADERGSLSDLLSFDLSRDDVAAILSEAGFKGYRFDAALAWIMKAAAMISDLS